MKFIVPAVLLLVAAIHALPLLGVLGASKLSSLYGIEVQEPNLEILLRHRAVLFGLLAALLTYCAFRSQLHRLGLMAAFVSVATFLAFAQIVGGYNSLLATVVRVDIIALVLLIIGGAVHVLRPSAA